MGHTTYSLSDIVNELLQSYATKSDEDEDSLRKAIQRVCKKIPRGKVSLWEKSTKYKPNAKKPYHVFTEEEKNLIISSPQMIRYIYHHLEPEKQEEYDNAEQQAVKESIAEQAALESGELVAMLREVELEEPDPLYVSDSEFQTQKLMLMLEALYLQQFESINDEELRSDMRLAKMWQGPDITPDCVLARNHLQQGSKYYCKLRDNKK